MSDKITYKKKEREVIDRAFSDITYMVENKVGGSLEQNLDRALKAARTQSHNLTEARAWVTRAFARGFETGETMLAKDLDGLTEWWLYGILTGIGYLVRGVERSDPADHARMYSNVKGSIVAHEAARARHLENL